MWIYKALERGEPERDPHEAEFFRLSEPSEALVREFIQNSLDASKTQGELVKVRFFLGEIEKQQIDEYLGYEFYKHINACGLAPANYNKLKSVPFLLIEDYGTTGLDGETGEKNLWPEGRNNFYNFWFWEGKSSKGGRDAGRWGVGKTTFHLISKLRAFWGLTVRSDDNRTLLMGKVSLKTHRIDSTMYQYYGYFREKSYSPITDQSIITKFKTRFSINRNNESGLSLIIPMPDDDIDITSIKRSVIIQYFYAILYGMLSVEISNGSSKIVLNSENLIELAGEEDWRGTVWKNMNETIFLKFIDRCIKNQDFFYLPEKCGHILDIDSNSFGENLDLLRKKFSEMEFLAIRVPVNISKTGKKVKNTYFDVFLKKDPSLKTTQEYYIRSGITILGMRTLGNRPVRALLVANDPIITEFLGDSETPAHTDWNERTEGFKTKYMNSVPILRYIKKSMGMILSQLDLPTSERKIDFLKDVFSIPQSKPDITNIKGVKKVMPEFESPPRLFNVNKLRNGLSVTLANKEIDLPIRAELKLAYDVRRRNPFNQYNINDFNLSGDSTNIKSSGCTIIMMDKNIIKFEVADLNFSFEIEGFDPKRDLVINIRELKNETEN